MGKKYRECERDYRRESNANGYQMRGEYDQYFSKESCIVAFRVMEVCEG